MHTFFQRTAGLIATAVLPLAAGALWAALSLRYRAELPWMALLCAATLWPARAHIPATSSLPRGLLGVLCAGIGIVYAQWLKSATLVAGEIGIGFLDALRGIGPDFVYALTMTRSSRTGMVMMALALLLAFAIGTVRQRPAVPV